MSTTPSTPVRRILLIDDDAPLRETLREALQQRLEDVEVLAAKDGPEALDVLARVPVDLMITDQRMPGMQGTDLLRVVAQRYPQMARALLTAYAQVPMAKTAVNEGRVHAFWTKPVPLREMVRQIGAMLEERHEAAQRARAFARALQSAAPEDASP